MRQSGDRRIEIGKCRARGLPAENHLDSTVHLTCERTQYLKRLATAKLPKPADTPWRSRKWLGASIRQGEVIDEENLVLGKPDRRGEVPRREVIFDEGRRTRQQEVNITPQVRFELPQQNARQPRRKHQAMDVDAFIDEPRVGSIALAGARRDDQHFEVAGEDRIRAAQLVGEAA
jgi:hypothetical protein